MLGFFLEQEVNEFQKEGGVLRYQQMMPSLVSKKNPLNLLDRPRHLLMLVAK